MAVYYLEMIEHLYIMKIVITYNFILLKTSFLMLILNPSYARYILHCLHGHYSGTHILILNLKALKDLGFFI